MCGRFSLALPVKLISKVFETVDMPNFKPAHNIAPSHNIPIVAIGKDKERHLIMARWGLVPSWMDKDPDRGPLFNARSETLLEKKSFKNAFLRRRCIIPADGFFEWKAERRKLTPYYFYRNDTMPIAFAGLWEMKKMGDEAHPEVLISTTIITTNSSNEFSSIHPRFPVILEKEQWKLWLNNETSPNVLENIMFAPTNGIISCHPVGADVNKVANNYAAIKNQVDEISELPFHM